MHNFGNYCLEIAQRHNNKLRLEYVFKFSQVYTFESMHNLKCESIMKVAGLSISVCGRTCLGEKLQHMVSCSYRKFSSFYTRFIVCWHRIIRLIPSINSGQIRWRRPQNPRRREREISFSYSVYKSLLWPTWPPRLANNPPKSAPHPHQPSAVKVLSSPDL